VEQPPQPPPQRPWGQRPQQWGQPQQQPPPPQPPQRPWGERPQPQQPWGYRPPQEPRRQRPPGAPPPWYRHPVGMLLIGAVVVILLALILPAFTAGDEPTPTVTTAAFGPPGSTLPPAATTTTAGQPAGYADRLRQAAQAELREAGEVTAVTAPPGGQITVTWEITRAGTAGLTENNARFGVMRIMRAIQATPGGAGEGARGVRLVGRHQLPGQATPATVVRLRFDPATVERTQFDDRRYLEAFELADGAVVHPSFRG
jgi:hypothetical protein